MHTILLKLQQYYNTAAPTYFGPYCPIIGEHTDVQNNYLTFSAFSTAAENFSLCNMYVVARAVRWKTAEFNLWIYKTF